MLDVNKLALLREVSLHGSVTAAAQSLQTSPSNVSQRLQKLETDTGVKLLVPAGRGVELTPQAKKLVDHTEEVLAILELAEQEMIDAKGAPTGSIRLIAFHTFAISMLASVANKLKETAPGLTLDFRQLDPESAIDELLARRADIVVADEYPTVPLEPSRGLQRQNLGKERIKAFIPADSASPETAIWALEPRGSAANLWAKAVCHRAGFTPDVRFYSPDPYVHLQLLRQGVAGAFLPTSLNLKVTGREVRFRASADALMHRELLTLVRRGTERSTAIRACRDAIAKAFTEKLQEVKD